VRWARGLLAVVGVVVAFGLTPGAYAQSVVATPGGPPQDLSMQLAADQTTGTASFFLRNDAPTAIDGLGLAVVVYDPDKHVLSSVSTSFGKPGETQPTSTWQVPPQGVVQVVLTLSNLPALASFSGDVFGQRTGTPSQRLAGLSVTRLSKVILRGAPPPASGSPAPPQTLTLRSNSAAPRFELTLDNDSPVPATGVRVDVGSPVRGDGGAGPAASMTINTDSGQVPQTLDPHALHRLTLAATLPEQTDYAAWVDVHFDPNQLQRYAVQLSRVAAPNNVTIDDPKPAANELWFGVVGAQPADLVVTVRETGGVSTSV